MANRPQPGGLEHLPVTELTTRCGAFWSRCCTGCPTGGCARGATGVQGILGGQSPQVTRMASGVARETETAWPLAKRLYRFLWNERFQSSRPAERVVRGGAGRGRPLSPGVSGDRDRPGEPGKTVHDGVGRGVYGAQKHAPAPARGETPSDARLSGDHGDCVNLSEPVVTYANWFSYETADFVSENREIYRAIRISRALFPQTPCAS